MALCTTPMPPFPIVPVMVCPIHSDIWGSARSASSNNERPSNRKVAVAREPSDCISTNSHHVSNGSVAVLLWSRFVMYALIKVCIEN